MSLPPFKIFQYAQLKHAYMRKNILCIYDNNAELFIFASDYSGISSHKLLWLRLCEINRARICREGNIIACLEAAAWESRFNIINIASSSSALCMEAVKWQWQPWRICQHRKATINGWINDNEAGWIICRNRQRHANEKFACVIVMTNYDNP